MLQPNPLNNFQTGTEDKKNAEEIQRTADTNKSKRFCDFFGGKTAFFFVFPIIKFDIATT